MKDQATYSEVFARLAEIDAEFGTLCDERDRLRAAMRADGNKRARLAMTDAGFVFGESIISTARWNEQIGVLIKVQVQSSPWKPGTTWHFEVWYRSILKSGRLGQTVMDADIAALRERIRLRLISLPDDSDEAKWLAVTLAELDMAFPEPHAIGKRFERIKLYERLVEDGRKLAMG